MTKFGTYDMMKEQNERCYIKAVSPRPSRRSKMRGVVLMGNDIRKIIFRFVVCAVIVILIMLLTAPKVC